MSPRKPTVDDLDDVDDEDGEVAEGARRQTDLKLHVRRAEEVALGGTVPGQDDTTDEREER